MKIICVIPARYASARFPGKPLVEIGGKPMIQLVYEQALKSKYIQQVYVATDDERIFNAVKNFGGNAVMTSPNEPSGTDRIASAVTGLDYDIVVNVQGDEPFIDPDSIDKTIKAMVDDEQCMVSTPKIRIKNEEDYLSPHCVKVVSDTNDYALYFSRSPIPNKIRVSEKDDEAIRKFFGFKHLGLYVYRREALEEYVNLKQTFLEKIEKLEQLRFLENGYKIKVVEVEHDSIGIDTPDDLKRVIKEKGL